MVGESEGGEVESPWTTTSVTGQVEVGTMLGDARLLGEILGRIVETLGTFKSRRGGPGWNSGGDRRSGDSWPKLGKMQTIGGFSGRFRQEGGRGSRGGPCARVRRVEAAAASLAGGGEGRRRYRIFEKAS
jgi:hypothetical protein